MNPDKVFGILSEPDRIKDRKLSRKKVHLKWEEDNLQLNSRRKLYWRFSEKKNSLENLQPSMGTSVGQTITIVLKRGLWGIEWYEPIFNNS
jgi:hypothetical protein